MAVTAEDGDGETTRIRMSALSKAYMSRRGKKVVALRSITGSVHKGELFVLVGRNGAGKILFLKSLSCAKPSRPACTRTPWLVRTHKS